MTRNAWTPLTAVLVIASACTGQKPASLPPPVYEEPQLPVWEPPDRAEEDDPFSDLTSMEGEWVVDEAADEASPEESEPRGADTPPEGDETPAFPEGNEQETESEEGNSEEAPDPSKPAPGAEPAPSRPEKPNSPPTRETGNRTK